MVDGIPRFKSDEEKKAELRAKRLANLTPIKKGQVLNPNGRKKKELVITTYLCELANMPYPIDEPRFKSFLLQWGIDPKAPRAKVLAQIMWMAAPIALMKGNVTIVKELFDRVEGKVTQPISGEGGGPIPIVPIPLTPEQIDKYHEFLEEAVELDRDERSK